MNFDEYFAQAHVLAWETLQRDEISATASRDRQLYELERRVWIAAQAEQREADAGICDLHAYENAKINKDLQRDDSFNPAAWADQRRDEATRIAARIRAGGAK